MSVSVCRVVTVVLYSSSNNLGRDNKGKGWGWRGQRRHDRERSDGSG